MGNIIEVLDVSRTFQVPGGEFQALKHINAAIPESSFVILKGRSGSGKTTLVSFIPRLYDTDEGEVLVGGINVKDYSLKHLRDGVSMVLQKNVLFSGSIEENLKWGKEDATMEEIRSTARLISRIGSH